MKVLFLCVSSGKPSKSHTLAEHCAAALAAASPETEVEWMDFAKNPLPPFDGPGTWSDPRVTAAKEQIASADVVLFATPIYNYTLPSAAKSLLELTGDAWSNKVVGFLCTAGGSNSYMAPIGFANCLMLDYRCVIIPRFVYATGNAFGETGELADEEIIRRSEGLARDVLRFDKWIAAGKEG